MAFPGSGWGGGTLALVLFFCFFVGSVFWIRFLCFGGFRKRAFWSNEIGRFGHLFEDSVSLGLGWFGVFCFQIVVSKRGVGLF